jgi:hypothetical protein
MEGEYGEECERRSWRSQGRAEWLENREKRTGDRIGLQPVDGAPCPLRGRKVKGISEESATYSMRLPKISQAEMPKALFPW